MATLLIVLAVGTLVLASCGNDDDSTVGPVGPVGPGGPVGEDGDGVEGSGDVIAETRDVSGFRRVVLVGEGRVIITQGDTESLEVTTDDNLLQYIETNVNGQDLVLVTTTGVDIDPTESVTYRVGVIEMDHVELVGAGSIEMDGWEAEMADIYLLGVGDIEISALATPELSVIHGGVGDVVLTGEVESQDVGASGVGEYDGADLRSSSAVVHADELGKVTIWVTDKIDASAAEQGFISYYGSPEDVAHETSGTGTIEPLGDR